MWKRVLSDSVCTLKFSMLFTVWRAHRNLHCVSKSRSAAANSNHPQIDKCIREKYKAAIYRNTKQTFTEIQSRHISATAVINAITVQVLSLSSRSWSN